MATTPTPAAAESIETGISVAASGIGKRFAVKSGRTSDLRELFSLRFNTRLRNGSGKGDAAPSRGGGQDDDGGGFWALRDVSFTVQPGEAVGIVGHNGSGKSTLLKMLTGILEPTEGDLQVNGRVGALIEVGAGFHPDLTGRENVYLNGQILGLARREIASHYDDIVRFAGLERFMDTPVKRYSSGMYMRLGFSIAVHVQPDVLLIDEVLAVGDELFQRKCLRRMQEFVRNGGIALFVSHSMAQVATLCPRTIWLDNGHLLFDGPTDQAAERYMAVVAKREEEAFRRERPEEWAAREADLAEALALAEAEKTAQNRRTEDEIRGAERAALERRERDAARATDPNRARITSVRLLDACGNETTVLPVAEPCQLAIGFVLPVLLPNPVFALEIFRVYDDLMLFATNTHLHGLDLRSLVGEGVMVMHIAYQSISAGRYRVRLQIFPNYDGDDNWLKYPPEDGSDNALTFQVDAGKFGHGCTFLPVRWDVISDTPATAEVSRAGSDKD